MGRRGREGGREGEVVHDSFLPLGFVLLLMWLPPPPDLGAAFADDDLLDAWHLASSYGGHTTTPHPSPQRSMNSMFVWIGCGVVAGLGWLGGLHTSALMSAAAFFSASRCSFSSFCCLIFSSC